MDITMFTCVRCDAELEIADPRNSENVTCGRCGQTFRLAFAEDEMVWELIPAPDEEWGSTSEEKPFAIGIESAGLGFLEDEERTP